MQMACIEAARNLRALRKSTTEFGETPEPVVGLITEWMSKEGLQQRAAGGDLGGTMRLGAYPAKLNGNSVVHSIYGSDEISERHRRYEVNIHYRIGWKIRACYSPECRRTASCRRSSNGPITHGSSGPVPPELKRPAVRAASLFASFIEAAVKQSRLV